MKKNVSRRALFAICFMLVVVLSGTVAVYAVDVEHQAGEKIIDEYEYISSASTNLSISGDMATNLSISGDMATASAKITRESSADRVKITMNLQQKKDNEWNTVKSWGKNSSSRVTYIEKTKTVSGGLYRVYTKVITYTGDDSETIKIYSKTKKH